MIYKYDGFPLYEEEDRDIAIDALCAYLTGDNKSEQKFLYDEVFNIDNIIEPSFIRESVSRSYGVNVHTMANFLSVQNAYFSKYIGSILEYLHYCGQEAYASTIRPSLITPFSIIKLFRSGELTKSTSYWNPNNKWTNFNITNDKIKNIMNPINIFYISDIIIKKADKEFIEYLSINTGLTNLLEDRTSPRDFSMRLLPSSNPCALIETVKLLHNYF